MIINVIDRMRIMTIIGSFWQNKNPYWMLSIGCKGFAIGHIWRSFTTETPIQIDEMKMSNIFNF